MGLRSAFTRLLPKSLRPEGVTIPVIRLQGVIAAGGGALRPSLSLAATAGMIEKAFAYKDAPAVAVVVNSPGGSPVQSRLIFKRLRDLADEKNKKLYVFVEDAAASGGYMIAVAGDEIIADPSSIVGSIGVISGTFGFVDLIKKIGVERRVHTAGQNKSVMDPFKPEKKEDVARLDAIMNDMHAHFIDLVKSRRGARLKDDPDLFTGLFWTGNRALELGLIDGIGDLRSTLKARYGEKTKLALVSGRKGLLGRFGIGGSLALMPEAAAQAAAAVLDAADERALWSRLGL